MPSSFSSSDEVSSEGSDNPSDVSSANSEQSALSDQSSEASDLTSEASEQSQPSELSSEESDLSSEVSEQSRQSDLSSEQSATSEQSSASSEPSEQSSPSSEELSSESDSESSSYSDWSSYSSYSSYSSWSSYSSESSSESSDDSEPSSPSSELSERSSQSEPSSQSTETESSNSSESRESSESRDSSLSSDSSESSNSSSSSCSCESFDPASAGIAMFGGTPRYTLEPDDYGYTDTEQILIDITACSDGMVWTACLTGLTGEYSLRARLLPPNQQEVTGPTGNTTDGNYCDQVTELSALGYNAATAQWYMLQAVQAHEQVHADKLLPALQAVSPAIEAKIAALSVPDTGQGKEIAVAEIKGSAEFIQAVQEAFELWDAEFTTRIEHDHDPGGPTDTAEHAVVDPMIKSICDNAKENGWIPCPACPP